MLQVYTSNLITIFCEKNDNSTDVFSVVESNIRNFEQTVLMDPVAYKNLSL